MPQTPTNTKPHPRLSWVSLSIVVLGSCITIVSIVGVVLSLLDKDAFGIWFGLGWLVFSVWGSFAALGTGDDPGRSYGGVLGLGGFMAGSVLALFEGPSDIWRGSTADSTPWQTFCWFIGVASFIATVEFSRRKNYLSQKN